MIKKEAWYEKLQRKAGDTDEAVGATKHQRGKRKPHGWKRTRKQARVRAKMTRRRNQRG